MEFQGLIIIFYNMNFNNFAVLAGLKKFIKYFYSVIKIQKINVEFNEILIEKNNGGKKFINAIFNRVSVRQCEEKEVPNALIVKILRAAMAAPSAVNQQPWEFYVTTDKEIISKLAKVHPYATPAKNAPVVIIPCYRTENLNAPIMVQIDMALATENILLEVEELGLGAVMLGIAPDEERMKAVEKILNLPENFRAFTIIPIGYPKNKHPQEDRYEPSKIHVI